MGGDDNIRLKQKIDIHKMTIHENISKFFEKFSQSNKIIFSKLKDTVNNEENEILGSLNDLTNRIKIYLSEEILLANKSESSMTKYPMSNVNLRKNEILEKKK